VEARPLTDLLQTSVTQDFRLDDVAVRPPDNRASSPTIVGQVVNTGEKAASDVHVTAAIFDDEGKLFQVVTATVAAPTLAPGESAPFRLQPVGRGLTEIPRYELFVEGQPAP
jgi:hypothetical protein